MTGVVYEPLVEDVALLAEGVDRNVTGVVYEPLVEDVALLAEGVDRNVTGVGYEPLVEDVALLAEGVDRNKQSNTSSSFWNASPSSRRAWIEIPLCVEVSEVVAGRPPRGGRG